MVTDIQVAIGHYRVVPGESRLNIYVSAQGLLSAFGHNPEISATDFSGEVELLPEFQFASARVGINASGLHVTNDLSEKDRTEIEQSMRDNVLEVGKYPEIVFESTNISSSRLGPGRYRVRVIGDLTIHGATQKNLWISGEVRADGDSLRGQGEFTIKQTDFNIKLVSAVGGMLKVKNEVKCSFDLLARKSD